MANRHHVESAPESHAATRQALLTAAADVFAEAGFRNATIRDICRRAKANVAAVNYHFGDKAALYSEVLAEQSRLARERFPAGAAVPELGPDEQLQAFIRSFLQRVLSPELHARHGRIMAREMVDPTAALDRNLAYLGLVEILYGYPLDGVILITAVRYRTQERNRADAIERLQGLVDKASIAPVYRVPTKPTRASTERRLEGKAKRSTIKSGRGRPGSDD
jgi:AcrR family transcriptional regulator